jgi:hypothetical protein
LGFWGFGVLGFGFWGLRFGVWVWGLGFGVWVLDLRFRMQGKGLSSILRVFRPTVWTVSPKIGDSNPLTF